MANNKKADLSEMFSGLKNTLDEDKSKLNEIRATVKEQKVEPVIVKSEPVIEILPEINTEEEKPEPKQRAKEKVEKPKKHESGLEEMFATVAKPPKSRVSISIDSDIAAYVNEMNDKYNIDNISAIYNMLLRKVVDESK